MPKTITRTRKLLMDVEDCGICGILFAVDRQYLNDRREDLAVFYCPNGHGMSYTESESDRLRAALTATRDQLSAANRRTAGLRERSRRERARISNGVCPCCKRSFSNLARHMNGQHPGYAEAGEATGTGG